MSSAPENGLEKLKHQIGNYEGYGETSLRKQSDKIVRLFLIGKIKNLLEQLSGQYHAASEDDQNRLDALLTSTRRKLFTINQSLNSPTYEQGPFFQAASMPAKRLSRLYDLEKGMLEETNNISIELADLVKNSKERTVFEAHFLHIDAFVDNINQALFEREALILGDI